SVHWRCPEAVAATSACGVTAYLYFPTQEALMLEVAALNPAVEPVERMLATLPPDDVPARLRQLLDTFNRIVFAEEVPMRSALRAYLDTWLENRRHGAD